MKSLELTEALHKAAKRCFWYASPERAVLQPANFVAHILTFGALEDVNALRAQYSNEDIARALDEAPAGVYDARSWAYWNLVVGRYETPPMPVRCLP